MSEASDAPTELGDKLAAAAPPGGKLDRGRSLAAVQRALFGQLDQTTRVGRFVLLDRLGSGAMGVVYSAHDPQLDRKVALKLLHPDTDPDALDERVARLLREAKTLARLDHPNVVTIHEVGEIEDSIFIAMQFVDGADLRDWLAAHEPGWREVVRLFIAAGRGLAAAHREGLVHRDFKPDNVLVDGEGHVRVADFGLARLATDASLGSDDGEDASTVQSPAVELDASPSGSGIRSMTGTGTVLGTPAYMAPEVWDGRAADARTDQYSYCVALYEALFGARPFQGASAISLFERARSMELSPAPGGADVPTWLRRLVLRGLSPEPDDRHVDMRAVVQQLERGLQRRRNWMVGAPLAVVVVAAAYGLGTRAETPAAAAAEPECPDAQTLRDQLWDGRRDVLATAFATDARPWVPDMAEGALTSLDGWAQRWAAARLDACEATNVRAEQSEALLDRRVECYEHAAVRLRALVDLLLQREEALEDAPKATAALPDFSLCADREWLESRRPLPRGEETGARVEALHEALAEATLLHRAGGSEEAYERAKAALAEVEALDYAPLRSEALFLIARTQRSRGNLEEAEAALNQAMTEALAGGDHVQTVDCALELISYVGADGKRTAERERWTTVAEGILAKMGSPPRMRARLLNTQAIALRNEGDFQGSLKAAQDALAAFEEAGAARSANAAASQTYIAQALDALGRPEEGLQHALASVEIEREVWGARHPRVAESLSNVGVLQCSRGKREEGAAALAESLAILEEARGPDSIDIVSILTNLAEARRTQVRLEESLALNVRALEIRERVLGPDHVEVATNLANMGATLSSMERHADAEARLRRALQIREDKLGADHPAVAFVHFNLANALEGQKRWDEALAQAEQARDGWRGKFGDKHPTMGISKVKIGEIHLAKGDNAAAIPWIEEGLVILEAAHGPDHFNVQSARATLERARQ